MGEQSVIKLSQFSKGGGCGCKIAPAVLEKILAGAMPEESKNLLVGYQSRDDAAVYDTGREEAIISTTDFFLPIVDDPFDFGRIAAANAISDVYAMGGKPLMAVAILGWPVEKIDPALAKLVLDGARTICKEAGIPLAGGHSIDSADPIFGLAVTGQVNKSQIKRNDTPKKGDLLFLTKPLGTGILSTALKRGLLKEEEYKTLLGIMTKLNRIGETLGKYPEVHAMTDVTGFGLTGHLLEMIGHNNLTAVISYQMIPKIPGVESYMAQFVFPDNTTRNYSEYKDKVKGMDGTEFILLCDPQTSGGLLVAVDPSFEERFRTILSEQKEEVHLIGKVVERKDPAIGIDYHS